MPLLLAILFVSCTQFANQLYLPVLPTIASDFSLTNSFSQALIICYLIALGIAQLIAGPCADKYGDRKVITYGLLLLITGTLICAFSTQYSYFLVGRVLQGFGCAAPVIISRTILARSLNNTALKSAMANLAIAASITAIITPSLAGILAQYLHWQGLTLVYAGYLVLILSLCLTQLKVQETAESQSKQSLLSRYRAIFQNRQVLFIANIKWLPTYLYITLQLYLPFFMAEQFAMNTQQIGYGMTWPMVGLLLGTTLAKWMQKTTSYLTIILRFLPLLPLAAVLFLYAHFNAFIMIAACAMVMAVFGAYFPSYMHILGIVQPTQTGSANALVGAIELLFFSCLAWFTNLILMTNAFLLCPLVISCAGLLWLSWGQLKKHPKLYQSA